MGLVAGAVAGAGDLWADIRTYVADPMKPPQLALGSALAAIWSWIEGPIDVMPKPSLAASDNLQTPMNLVMPLRYPGALYRGLVVQMLSEAADAILAGLNNVGTVHFARFDIIDGNLCMFSIFDGDFRGYIRDFIGVIGEAFDAIMEHVKDPPLTPCGQHVDGFIEWVHRHDALQLPEVVTDVTPDLVALQRQNLVLMHRNKNAQLGVYRGYPGYSVAQIRNGLGVGW